MKHHASFASVIALLFYFLASPAGASGREIVLRVKGLSCPLCVYGVEKHLQRVEGIESLETHYKKATVVLKKKPKAQVNPQALTTAVQNAGFTLDRIEMTVVGNATLWEGRPAIKDATSDQLFLLVAPAEDHHAEELEPKKWKEIQKWKKVSVHGTTHPHVGLPAALTVEGYEKVP